MFPCFGDSVTVFYSALSANNGSTFKARRPGTTQAPNAAIATRTETLANTPKQADSS